jgi:hypothetical protein
MFAPGGSPDMELPLRAHRQTREGRLGVTPLGRSLTLGNVEWRRRVVSRAAFQAGFVLFYDAARIARRPDGENVTLHDVGAGLRLAFAGSPVLRLDYGHGLTDGKNAFFMGLNQVF